MSGDDSAFPEIHSDRDYADDPVQKVWSEGGMTKRELMATMIIAGMYSGVMSGDTRSNTYREEAMAENAVVAADALIKALEREESIPPKGACL